MPFHLECAGSFSTSNASEADIHRAFDDDELRGEYIILTGPSGDFMQAAGEGDGPYTLEHRSAGADEHIEAADECTKDDVRSAFLAFLRGDPSWRNSRTWRPLTASPPAQTGVCERCGERAEGRRQWMIYSYWIDREFYCFRCLRIMRIYAIIGGTLAALTIGALIAVSLWLMYGP